MNDYLEITLAGERARIYREGTTAFDVFASGTGWTVTDSPSHDFAIIAQSARAIFRCTDAGRPVKPADAE